MKTTEEFSKILSRAVTKEELILLLNEREEEIISNWTATFGKFKLHDYFIERETLKHKIKNLETEIVDLKQKNNYFEGAYGAFENEWRTQKDRIKKQFDIGLKSLTSRLESIMEESFMRLRAQVPAVPGVPPDTQIKRQYIEDMMEEARESELNNG